MLRTLFALGVGTATIATALEGQKNSNSTGVVDVVNAPVNYYGVDVSQPYSARYTDTGRNRARLHALHMHCTHSHIRIVSSSV